jgi:hypothetical protein
VGVGVQKAGTTWWFDLIAAHPGVALAPGAPKEVHYFDRFWAEPFDEAARVGYRRWFPRPPGARTGEWTPRYLHDVWVPPLLARSAPEARLLVVLRDPLERFRSGRAHEQRRRGADPAVGTDAFHRGCYGAQLERLFGHVDPTRVLVLQYERNVADPAAELARTYRFLGLDDGFVPGDLTSPRNASGELAPIDPEVRTTLRELYVEDLVRLSRLVPSVDLDRWPTWTGRGT